MQWELFYHVADMPYAFAVGSHELKLRIRVKRGEVRECHALHGDRYQPQGKEQALKLNRIAWDQAFDYFEGIVPTKTRRIRYVFHMKGTDGTELYYGERGAAADRDAAGVFQFAYIAEQDRFVVPDWVHDAVVYQIFPERFHNGDPGNDPDDTLPWNEPLTRWDCFYGGDLAGITQKLPYLEQLGINAIYLTPVFQSPTNHKYDTIDYYKIDPDFGDLAACKQMVEEAHKRGIRVIFDAVFNHCGDRFFAFQDVLEHGVNSKYADWFFIDSYPVVQKPAANYETFANNIHTMPKLNTKNPEVREYLLKVARYWIDEAGIDGWRLDVANEVDHDFWRAFRKTVKEANPEAVIIGEIWHDSRAWLRGDEFDGVMNYLFKEALYEFFAKQSIGVRSFNSRLTQSRMIYSDQANASMFNLIDSHDTERFLTSCEKSGWGWGEEKRAVDRMKLAAFFQLTYPGMAMIYYGDEVGMKGETDPHCRYPMVWEEKAQNGELLQLYKQLLALRKELPVLRRGGFAAWIEDELHSTYGYLRHDEEHTVAMLINNSPSAQTIPLRLDWKKPGETVLEHFTGKKYEVSDDQFIELPAYGYAILR
jgi:cyclomaltodextrinase